MLEVGDSGFWTEKGSRNRGQQDPAFAETRVRHTLDHNKLVCAGSHILFDSTLTPVKLGHPESPVSTLGSLGFERLERRRKLFHSGRTPLRKLGDALY